MSRDYRVGVPGAPVLGPLADGEDEEAALSSEAAPGGVDGATPVGIETRVATVDAAFHGQRLDRLLVHLAPEFSRNHLQGLIAGDHVSVDGTVATTAARKLRVGQQVQQSEVIAVVQAVPGVVALDLDWLYGGTLPAAQTTASLQKRLLASRARVVGGAVLGAELLTLAPTPLIALGVMT